MLKGNIGHRAKVMILLLLAFCSHCNINAMKGMWNSPRKYIPLRWQQLDFVYDNGPEMRHLLRIYQHTMQSLGYLNSDLSLKPSGDRLTDAFLDEYYSMATMCEERATKLHDMEVQRSDYIKLRIGILEAESVKRLTILATVFLPLSLGTGLLSMQSRISNVHLVLYDYVGLILNMALLIFIYLAIFRFEYHSRFYRRNVRRIRRIQRAVRPFVVVISISVAVVLLLHLILACLNLFRCRLRRSNGASLG
jgi:hypothetical protein